MPVIINGTTGIVGVDGEYTAFIQSNTVFDSQQADPFIPYNELTQEIVIGWVQNSLGPNGIANYEANVQGQINSMINPPATPQNTPLPWRE